MSFCVIESCKRKGSGGWGVLRCASEGSKDSNSLELIQKFLDQSMVVVAKSQAEKWGFSLGDLVLLRSHQKVFYRYLAFLDDNQWTFEKDCVLVDPPLSCFLGHPERVFLQASVELPYAKQVEFCLIADPWQLISSDERENGDLFFENWIRPFFQVRYHPTAMNETFIFTRVDSTTPSADQKKSKENFIVMRVCHMDPWAVAIICPDTEVGCHLMPHRVSIGPFRELITGKSTISP